MPSYEVGTTNHKELGIRINCFVFVWGSRIKQEGRRHRHEVLLMYLVCIYWNSSCIFSPCTVSCQNRMYIGTFNGIHLRGYNHGNFNPIYRVIVTRTQWTLSLYLHVHMPIIISSMPLCTPFSPEDTTNDAVLRASANYKVQVYLLIQMTTTVKWKSHL